MRPSRGAPIGNFLYETVQLGLPHPELFFVPAAQSEIFKVVVPAPEHCKGILTCGCSMSSTAMTATKVDEPAEISGSTFVTLFRKMRPLSRSGVFRFFEAAAPGSGEMGDTGGFLRIELLLPTFRPF